MAKPRRGGLSRIFQVNKTRAVTTENILCAGPPQFSPVPQQAMMGVQGPFEHVMQATKFFPPASSAPLNGEQWAVVGAETQVLFGQILNFRTLITQYN
jgi:hypothetical protein